MLSRDVRVGAAGAAVVGVSFGMARYAYGLTLPDVRRDLGLSELLLGVVAAGTATGYLLGLLLAGPLAARRGPRAPTMLGSACGALGCVLVTVAPSPLVLTVGAVLAGSASGWVWAPYSDIVGRLASSRRQPRLLAVISTGTSIGLVALGLLGLAAMLGSWRWVWAGTAAAATLAGLANLRAVPPLDPPERGQDWGVPRDRALLRPVAYAAVYFAATILYLTYAGDAVSGGGLPGAAVPALYAVVGLAGLVALRTGHVAHRLGSPRVAGLSVGCVGLALIALALASGSPPALAGSAVLFGASYMTGSAVLAIWVADVLPDRPGAGFSVALVVGAATSIAAPVVVGALAPSVGLANLLVATAVLAGATGAWLVLPRRLIRRYGPGTGRFAA